MPSMSLLASIAVFLLAALHVYIMALEMFFWTSPAGLRAFALKPDFAAQTKNMAANQGLYNGFLAAGLLWSLVHPDTEFASQISQFFAGCVLVAGVYGGVTANRKIFFVQALPGALCLTIVLFG
jgi:putative membrane protein